MIPRFLAPFRLSRLPVVETDVLILGSGLAGLRAAIEAARSRRVLVVSKKGVQESNSFLAQGGIAAALGDQDRPESHIEDTLRVGCGLADPGIVELVVREGLERVQELIGWGARFDREGGRLAFGREGGHSVPRILHRGDGTGAMLIRTLLKRVRARILENAFAVDLVTRRGACWGAVVHHSRRGLVWVRARRTILATGGVGQVFRETTNPSGATGDGIAMAYRAGAELADLEFLQFHPTTLYLAGATRALISEAVRGAGAVLRDRAGRTFMEKYHSMADLAPRDVVSRAILRHMMVTRDTQVYLDCRSVKDLARKFPGLSRLCREYGMDPRRDLIPVRPAAHYTIGGIRTDAWGRTSVRNLFACGECACSGLHGANRLASNSLLECLVFGRRSGAAAAQEAHEPVPDFDLVCRRPVRRQVDLDVEDIRNSLRSVMWRQVGVERDADGLRYALESVEFWSGYVLDRVFEDPAGWELQNMMLLGRLMAVAAIRRAESRGAHYRRDYPRADDLHWKARLVFRLEGRRERMYMRPVSSARGS